MSEPENIKSIKSLTLDLPPCCIEFWPLDRRWAVVGTYYLEGKDGEREEEGNEEEVEEEKTQLRNGSLILLDVDGEGEGGGITITSTHPTPSAILDLHFSPHDPAFFVTATSTGSLDLYTLTFPPTKSTPEITHIKTHQWFTPTLLVTSFSFHPSPAHHLIGCTVTDGSVHIGRIFLPPSEHTEDEISPVQIASHALESWILAFSADGKIVFSGGDDSAIIAAPVPSRFLGENECEDDGDEGLEEQNVLWTEGRVHGAGVVAILPLSLPLEVVDAGSGGDDGGNLVITGSYDDCIRLLCLPAVGRRRVLAECNLGGGVWRVKVLGVGREGGRVVVRLLVCCMYAGARVVRLCREKEGGEWGFEVLGMMTEHASMCYALDWRGVGGEGEGKKVGVVSTSFYDRLVCLWRV